MKTKKIISVFFIIFLISCNNYTNNIEVKNSSDQKIDSILIYGNQSCKPLKISNLKNGQTKINRLLNCETKNQGDGSYLIQVYIKNEKLEKRTGYFTNGTIIFKKMYILIDENNNIIVSEN